MNLVTLVLVVLGIISAVALLSMFAGNGSAARTKQACQKLILQAGKLIASSKQDGNPLFAVIDATAAVAHAEALAMVSSDENLTTVFKTTSSELLTTAQEQQRRAIKDLGGEFPSLLPDENSVIISGWV